MLLKFAICCAIIFCLIFAEVCFAVAECRLPPQQKEEAEFAPLATGQASRESQASAKPAIKRPWKEKAHKRRAERRHRRAQLLERVLPSSR